MSHFPGPESDISTGSCFSPNMTSARGSVAASETDSTIWRTNVSETLKKDIVQQLLQLNMSLQTQVCNITARSWSGNCSPASQRVDSGTPDLSPLTATTGDILDSYPTEEIFQSSCSLLEILNRASGIQRDDAQGLADVASVIPESVLDDPHTLFLVMSCYMGLIQLHSVLFGDMMDSLLGDASKRNAFQSALCGLRLGGVDLSQSGILSIKLLVQTVVHYLRRLEHVLGEFAQPAWGAPSSGLAGGGKSGSDAGARPGLDSFYHSSLKELWQKIDGVKSLLEIF